MRLTQPRRKDTDVQYVASIAKRKNAWSWIRIRHDAKKDGRASLRDRVWGLKHCAKKFGSLG